jgi:ribosome-associated toxin RatA of RatAB toxin-antitoxin module
MSDLKHSESIIITRSPEDLYDMVSDVTRMGEWSPVCKACWWDEGARPEVGAWFNGRNELPERTWETRSVVVAADRGHEFPFVVSGSFVRWGSPWELTALYAPRVLGQPVRAGFRVFWTSEWQSATDD